MVTNGGQPGLLELCETVLLDQGMPVSMPFALLCITSLPHREVPLDQPWVHQFPRCSVAVEPGLIHVQEPQGTTTRIRLGIPYGPRARILMLYFWREVRRTGQREIERAVSFRQYLGCLGLSAGGKTYHGLREQAERLVGCSLLFSFRYPHISGIYEEKIIDGGVIVRNAVSGRQCYETMVLGQRLYESLRDEPVPIDDGAITRIANQSFALDLYCWLAVLLPGLQGDVLFPWASLHACFGTGYAQLRHFKPRMLEALQTVRAVYSRARLRVDDEAGVTLQPSPPP